jgi:hypothetical protein
MYSPLIYLIAQERHIEVAHRAEQSRLAGEARVAVTARSARWKLSRLFAPRRLRTAGLAAAAYTARPGPAEEGVRCEP